MCRVVESTNNIVNGICNAFTKVEQNTVIPAKIGMEELTKVNQCSANHIKTEKKLLEHHQNKISQTPSRQ